MSEKDLQKFIADDIQRMTDRQQWEQSKPEEFVRDPRFAPPPWMFELTVLNAMKKDEVDGAVPGSTEATLGLLMKQMHAMQHWTLRLAGQLEDAHDELFKLQNPIEAGNRNAWILQERAKGRSFREIAEDLAEIAEANGWRAVRWQRIQQICNDAKPHK